MVDSLTHALGTLSIDRHKENKWGQDVIAVIQKYFRDVITIHNFDKYVDQLNHEQLVAVFNGMSI